MRARAAARAAFIPLLTVTCVAVAWSSHYVLRAQTPAAQSTVASNEAPAADAAQADAPAATRLTGVTVGSNADGVTVTLRGNGRLAYSAIQEADRPPARLVVDFQGVRPDVAASTPGQGVVRRVRVALNNAEPVVTRVVLDLERIVSHRLRPSSDGREVVITLESGAPSETTASASPSAPRRSKRRPRRVNARPRVSPPSCSVRRRKA